MKKECLILIIFLIGAIFLSYFWFLPKNTFADSQGTIVIKVKISVCGNNIKEEGEECDGTDLGGATCRSLGFTGGTLSCSASCNFNTSDCTSGGGGGGGGGGGAYVPPPAETKVIFTGRAYPNSTVTLLKDAQIAATTIADPNANFSISLSGLSAGNYIFSLYSEDNKGLRSSLLTFPISVTTGATTNVGGIFIAPTIAVDKSEVKRGDNIAIFGQSAPKAEITIVINSDKEFFDKTFADASGIYLYNFDTTQIDMGQHFTKSKAAKDGAISSFSKAVSFLVGTKNVFTNLPQKCPAKADLNKDCRVNLVDFSIAAYWYKRSSPPKNVDLNGDGKIDLVDFSIMAYYWTG
jgi:hypothetical protein